MYGGRRGRCRAVLADAQRPGHYQQEEARQDHDCDGADGEGHPAPAEPAARDPQRRPAERAEVMHRRVRQPVSGVHPELRHDRAAATLALYPILNRHTPAPG